MRIPAPSLWFWSGAALVAWLSVETWRLAELAGQQEVAAREARDAQAAAQRAHAALAAELAARAATVERLERELAQSIEQTRAITATLEQRIAEEARQQQVRAAEAELRDQPPPELVRIALRGLTECLAADGFSSLRFVRATALAERALRGVELVELDEDGLGTTLIVAEQMTVELDRTEGILTLRCNDGFRLAQGHKEPLPQGGLPLVFRPVSGRRFEERLPFLVTARGAWPAEPDPSAPRPGDVDPRTRAEWLARWNAFFSVLGGRVRYRLVSFRGLDDGRLLTARLHGYDRGNLLVLTADAEQLAVEVDEAAGVVSLLLKSGTLRQKGGRSTISADGYRMLLEDVTTRQAADALLGLVVRK
jgi:hypothetical protein